MTTVGGTNNFGTIFKIDSTGSSYTVLRNMASADGVFPQGSLVQGSDGSLYGMAIGGGSHNLGTIFKINTTGTTFNVLRSLAVADGANPSGSLIQGTDGNFYGMAKAGGTNNNGTIFKINATGATFTKLRTLLPADGVNPFNSLVQGSDGNFYGMTEAGGANNNGTIFKIDAAGTTYTVLRSLATADGINSYASLVQGSDGRFYGTTEAGGANNNGTIFSIDGAGSSFTLLRSLASADGVNPYGSLTQGSNGSFYGMTSGTVFKLAIGPALAAQVVLTVPSSVTHGTTFTLGYTVSNAYSTTVKRCVAFNSSPQADWTGIKTAAPTITNVTLTAPASPGSYQYGLQCGGTETGFVTLTVN